MTDTLRLVPPAAEAAANDGPAGGRRRVRISLLPDRHPDAGTLNPILRMIGPAISAACLAHDNRVVLDTLAAVYVGMAQALGARGPAVAQLQTMLAQLQPPRPPAAAAAERQAMPMPDHGDRQPVGQARQAKLALLHTARKALALTDERAEAALAAFIRRQTATANGGRGIDALAWLPPALARQVIEALKDWQRRVDEAWRT